MARQSLRLKSRFAVVLVVLLPSLMAILIVGYNGLRAGRDAANSLYLDHLVTTQSVTSLDIALEDAHQTSLEALLATGATKKRRLITELVVDISPRVQAAVARVNLQTAGDSTERRSARTVTDGWSQFQRVLVRGELTARGATHSAAAATAVTALFDSMTAAAKSIIAVEETQSSRAYSHALDVYRSSVELMLLAGLICLLISAGVVVWLIRSVLPRTLAFAAFATEVGEGRYQRSVEAKGSDELSDLGRVLNDLALRRRTEETYDQNQLELRDTLQTAASEQEARDLLRVYLERGVPSSDVTILNRNNSADRLQAVTPVDPNSPLIAGLESAEPRSCLAIRKGSEHTTSEDKNVLLPCPVCSGCPGSSICTPLIVGAEVIGSVLTNHTRPLDALEARSIREAVSQAAPVIGNLRTLAIAELRASTDSLTGLPNKRAVHDTLRRMVAQSSRTGSPMAALMCDLDHFKNINDRYGHGRGDDVLAAVGAILATALRASDFAGRFGGEEFVVLLPDTDAAAAHIAAETLRRAVAATRVADIEDPITVSIGIATAPMHAIDADSLLRAADRALYAAKNAGRNRSHLLTSQVEELAHRRANTPLRNATPIAGKDRTPAAVDDLC